MKELYKALADFQQEVPVILKEEEGYNAQYKFATWKSVMDTIKPLLKKHGLGFWQGIEVISGGAEYTLDTFDKAGVLTKSKKVITKNDNVLTTIVYHIETCQEIKSSVVITQGVELARMNDYQVLGSGLTYLKRYSLSNILGLITDKDDDGSSNVKNGAELFDWVSYFDKAINTGKNYPVILKTLEANAKNLTAEDYEKFYKKLTNKK